MRVVPLRSGSRAISNERRIIGPFAPEFGLATVPRRAPVSTANAWTSANDPLALPFRLNEPVTVVRLGWLNGATLTTSNFDIGVYTSSFVRLVSSGSTARSGASVWQWADVADTALPAGDYYLTGAGDTNVASRVGGTAGIGTPGLALMGAMESSTDAFPLPNPLTNMVAATTFTVLPWLAMEVTGTFAPASAPFQRLPATWMPESLYDNPTTTIATAGSFTNTLANQALYCPVYFPVSATIFSLSFAATNGTGNYDIGIYDGGFKRMASSGSTAMTAAGIKTLTFADKHVDAGTVLYIAGAWSNVAARFLCQSNAATRELIALGCAEEASALPLPATGTPVIVASATNLPLYSIGVR